MTKKELKSIVFFTLFVGFANLIAVLQNIYLISYVPNFPEVREHSYYIFLILLGWLNCIGVAYFGSKVFKIDTKKLKD